MDTKIIAKWAFTLSVLLLLTSCYRECDKVTRLDAHSYANCYICINPYTKMEARVDTTIYEDSIAIVLDFAPPYRWVGIEDKNWDEAEYSRYVGICQRHNDMEFYHELVFVGGYGDDKVFFDIGPVKIEITSDADWDSEHPAGSSLGDIAVFNATTPYPFIKNGYEGTEITMVKTTVDTLNPENLVLSFPSRYSTAAHEDLCGLALRPYITFKKNPEKIGQHTLAITLTDTYKRVYKTECKVNFE